MGRKQLRILNDIAGLLDEEGSKFTFEIEEICSINGSINKLNYYVFKIVLAKIDDLENNVYG